MNVVFFYHIQAKPNLLRALHLLTKQEYKLSATEQFPKRLLIAQLLKEFL